MTMTFQELALIKERVLQAGAPDELLALKPDVARLVSEVEVWLQVRALLEEMRDTVNPHVDPIAGAMDLFNYIKRIAAVMVKAEEREAG